jgi:hypothetical protein
LTVHIPHGEGKLMADIDRLADVRDRRYLQEGIEFDLRMNRTQFAQLRGRHPDLTIISGLDNQDEAGEPEQHA